MNYTTLTLMMNYTTLTLIMKYKLLLYVDNRISLE